MKRQLTWRITLAAAAVIFGTMLVWAVVSHDAQRPGPLSMVLEHLGHTVVLGILIYAVLRWRSWSLIVRPIADALLRASPAPNSTLVETIRDAGLPDQVQNEMDSPENVMDVIAAHLEFVKNTGWKNQADSIEFYLDHLQSGVDVPEHLYATLLVTLRHLRNMEAAATRLAQTSAEVVTR
jgi:hypothetical protein